MTKYPPFKERFEANISPEPNTGCYLWTAKAERRGYGVVDLNGKSVTAHRAAYELAFGPIPPGMCVCHKCDTPLCVNTDHLFLGTAKDNALDMARKGRSRFHRIDQTGERNHFAKLTEPKVVEMRRQYSNGKTISAISVDFSIPYGTAYSAVKGNGSWRWLKSHSTDSADYKPTQEPIPELEPEPLTEAWHGYEESRER